MFETFETGIGLKLVLELQKIHVAWFDTVAKNLDVMGDEFIYIVAIALIYWCFNKSVGARMYFALVAITLSTFILKGWFARPRPPMVSAEVHPLFHSEGYGIPSGHTAMSMMVWGYLAWHLRQRVFRLIVVGYVMLQAFERMYSGVHFPQDVIGGILLGLILLIVYRQVEDKVATKWHKARPIVQWLVPLGLGVVGLLLFANSQSKNELTSIGILLGSGLGIAFENQVVHFQPPTTPIHQSFHYLLGMTLTVGLMIGIEKIFGKSAGQHLPVVLRVLRYTIVSFFIVGLYPYLSLKLGFAEHEAGLSPIQSYRARFYLWQSHP
jgi:membrane-associated phospholipid phosphatase